MASLRTPETQAKYVEYIASGRLESGCALCAKTTLREFSHWKIVQNDFPYDRIASMHHMLIPKRHVSEAELTEEEHQEFLALKNGTLNDMYDYFLEAAHRAKTVPAHFHIHLVVLKE
jgi:diadenosine tetraphosphate (Ap4A) HIT family hydrolase